MALPPVASAVACAGGRLALLLWGGPPGGAGLPRLRLRRWARPACRRLPLGLPHSRCGSRGWALAVGLPKRREPHGRISEKWLAAMVTVLPRPVPL